MAHPKREKPYNNRQFLTHWIGGHAASWLALILVAIPVVIFGGILEPTLPLIMDWLFPFAFALGVGGFTALTQKRAILRRFGVKLSGWVRWSVLAWLIGGIIGTLTSETYLPGFSDMHVAAMQGVILFTLPALVQAWMLRKYINGAWLYVLASITGTMAFALPVAASEATFIPVIFGYGIYASVTGLSLLWLFGMTNTLPQVTAERDVSHLTYHDQDEDEDDWHDHDSGKKSYFIQG